MRTPRQAYLETRGGAQPLHRIRGDSRRMLVAALLSIAVFEWTPELCARSTASPASDTDAAAARIRAAQEFLSQRKFKEAIREFKAADTLAGHECAACQVGLAQAFNGMGAFKDALKSVDAALKLTAEPEIVGIAFNERGLALLASANSDPEKLERAAEAFRQAMQLTQESASYFNLGLTLLRLGRDEEGRSVLQEFLEQDPESSRAHEVRDLIENPMRARKRLLPDFDVVTLAGEYITPEELRGKVVLLDFWGTWCAPCRAAIPGLKRLGRRFEKKPFLLLSISNDDDEAVLRAFLEKHGMTWPQVWDRERQIVNKFGIEHFPTYLLADMEGEVVYSTTGWGDRVEREIGNRVNAAIRAAEKRSDQNR